MAYNNDPDWMGKLSDDMIEKLEGRVEDAVLDAMEQHAPTPSGIDKRVAAEAAQAFTRALYLELFKAIRARQAAAELTKECRDGR